MQIGKHRITGKKSNHKKYSAKEISRPLKDGIYIIGFGKEMSSVEMMIMRRHRPEKVKNSLVLASRRY